MLPPPNSNETINPEALLGPPAATTDATWLQVDCALFAQPSPRPAYFPWDSFRQALERWQADQLLTGFFLVRKPPGLRLRFCGSELTTRLQPALTQWLLEAEGKNDIRGFRFNLYEPELFRFGGPAGMAVAHLFFQHDTCRAMRYELVDQLVQEALPRPLLSLITTHDLLSKCVDDAAEMWDIWKRLELILQGVGGPDASLTLHYSPGVVTADDQFLAQTLPMGQHLIKDIRESNTQVAACLRATQLSSGLLVGVRAWLVAAVVFHWNRLGLTTAETSPMVATMLAHLQA